MKRTIYLSLLAGCLALLGACESSEYDLDKLVPEKYHKIMYVSSSGVQKITLFNTDEDEIYTFSVIKSGSDPTLTASVDINLMTQEEVDEKYGKLAGIAYKVVPSDVYSLDINKLDFSSSDRYKKVNVSLNPKKVLALLESNREAVWVLPLRATSETDSVNTLKNELILTLVDVVMPTVGFKTPGLNLTEYTTGKVPAIENNISFTLDTKKNNWDIACLFEVDEAYVSSYNEANRTSFQVLPPNLYSFTDQVSLATPSIEEKLKITVQGDQLPTGDYMLPIQLKSISKFEIDQKKALYLMAVRIMSPKLDRANWTAEANTEEKAKEGTNGFAKCVLDGSDDSFWHSEWSGPTKPALPHWLIIDTQAKHTFTQFSLVRRNDSNYTKAGKFYVSSDKQSWTEVGSFFMKEENGEQIYSVTPTTGRYYKIEMTESRNGDKCNTLAEVYAYGL